MAQSNIRWRSVATPNPAEMAFVVIIPQDVVRVNLSCIPQPGALFNTLGITGSPTSKSVGWIPDAALATSTQFGLYVYTDMKNQDTDILFFYGKPKTSTTLNDPDNPNTPFRRTWKKHGNHRWPPILKGIVLLEDNTFPAATNFIQNGRQGIATGAQYYDRYIYIPDTSEGTRFLLEEYLSPTPFEIPRYRTPVATSVQYSVNGLNGSFPECLHDDISIPPTRTSISTFLGGAAFTGNGALEGQFFPKTNFKTWLPYVLYDDQEQTEAGVWYRQRIRVFPPTLPRAIRRA